MKFIIAVALLCIGAVAAQSPAPQNNNRVLIETLEKRSSALLELVHKTVQEHNATHANLLEALNRQAPAVERLAKDLKDSLADTTRQFQLHHIHVLEEELFHLENRVSEEIAIIDQVRSGTDNRGENGTQLIARAERLVKDAKDAAAKFPNARELGEINSEVIVVEALVKTIQAKPAPTAAELQKDEQELARQERTLRQLIEKVTARPN